MACIKPETEEFSKFQSVLRIIEQGESTSRASIAKQLGLSRTTLSTLVNRLIEQGILTEIGIEIEGIGRPGRLLDLTTDRWYSIGAEYHSNQWVFVITNLKGDICEHLKIPVPDSRPETFLDKVVEGIKKIQKQVPGELLPSIGLGTPGLVDCNQGKIIRADDLGWKNVDIWNYVKSHTGFDSYIINRHRASGLAEARFGTGRNIHSLIYIGIGTGISAAFISDGVLLHGTTFSAGEIGHMTMDPAGPACSCGKSGCLHTLSSGKAMALMAEQMISMGRKSSLSRYIGENRSLDGEKIAEEALSGDKVALVCMKTAADWLGIAAANLITTFNPDKLIIGGPIGASKGPFLDMVRTQTHKWAMDYPLSAVKIEQSSLGENIGALGAATLVLDRKIELTFT